MFSFKNIFKRTVVVNLDRNVTLKVEPTVGGCHATLTERGEYFDRSEKAFFASLDELINSLQLTDNVIIGKLSKAF